MMHALSSAVTRANRWYFAACLTIAGVLTNLAVASAAALQTGSPEFDADLASVQGVELPWDKPLAILTHDLIIKVAVAVAVIALVIMGWEMTHRHEDTSGHVRKIASYALIAAVLLFGVSFIRGMGLTGNGALIHI